MATFTTQLRQSPSLDHLESGQPITFAEVVSFFNHDVALSYCLPITRSYVPSTRGPNSTSLAINASFGGIVTMVSKEEHWDAILNINERVVNPDHRLPLQMSIFSAIQQFRDVMDPTTGLPINCESAQQTSTIVHLLRTAQAMFRDADFFRRPIPASLARARWMFSPGSNRLTKADTRKILDDAKSYAPRYACLMEVSSASGRPDAFLVSDPDIFNSRYHVDTPLPSFQQVLTSANVMGPQLAPRDGISFIFVEEKLGVKDEEFVRFHEISVRHGEIALELGPNGQAGLKIRCNLGEEWAKRLTQLIDISVLSKTDTGILTNRAMPIIVRRNAQNRAEWHIVKTVNHRPNSS